MMTVTRSAELEALLAVKLPANDFHKHYLYHSDFHKYLLLQYSRDVTYSAALARN